MLWSVDLSAVRRSGRIQRAADGPGGEGCGGAAPAPPTCAAEFPRARSPPGGDVRHGAEEGEEGRGQQRHEGQDHAEEAGHVGATARAADAPPARRGGADPASRAPAAQAGPERPGHGEPHRTAHGRAPGRRGPGRRLPHDRARYPAPRQRPLPEGRRTGTGPVAGPPSSGEDHSLRPRTHSRARRARTRRRRPRGLPGIRHRNEDHQGGVPGEGRRDAGVREVLHRPRFTRFGGHGA